MLSCSRRIALLVGAGLSSFAAAGCSRSSPPGQAAAAGSASASAGASSSAAPEAGSFPVSEASLKYVLDPQGLPAYTGPTGSVEGTISVRGPAAPAVQVNAGSCPAAIDTYGALFRDRPPATPGGPRPLADAVVVVVGWTGYYIPEKADAVKVTIGTDCAYPARTLAITYGQRIEVGNATSLLFAPVIDQEGSPAVMVAPPEKGEPIKLYPVRAGRFTISDRLQPFVHEDLYVFRHPLHAVTDRNGHYRIDGVPVGHFEIGVAHPAFGDRVEAPVQIVAGVVQRADETLTYEPPPPPAKWDGGLPPKRYQIF